MVVLHVKRGDESQFLFETTVNQSTDDALNAIRQIYNGRLKIQRICGEIHQLAKHGTALPQDMVGLTDEQISELKLVDDWAEICVPSGGFDFEDDPIGVRNGRKPKPNLVSVLTSTVTQVEAAISKEKTLNLEIISEQLSLLKGAVTIVYPMGLPPNDPIRLEFEGNEDYLEGTQDHLQIISEGEMELWFCGKELLRGRSLWEFLSKNEKSKVIVKVQKKGGGPPGREPLFTEEQKKEFMLHAYRKQQEDKVSDHNF